MKTKKFFAFHSFSHPSEFIAKLKEDAPNSNLNLEQTENAFNLQLNSNHFGKIVYKATLSSDKNGGSNICGKITTIPWNDTPNKKKNIFEIIIEVLGYIIVSPFVLLSILCCGIYLLFFRLFNGKKNEPNEEEKLCDFMINKMCCTQKTIPLYKIYHRNYFSIQELFDDLSDTITDVRLENDEIFLHHDSDTLKIKSGRYGFVTFINGEKEGCDWEDQDIYYYALDFIRTNNKNFK